MISVPGLGSGMDITSVVDSLMDMASIPLESLKTKESSYQTELSTYGTLKSAVSTFEDAMAAVSSTSNFVAYQSISTDESIFTATADASASVGQYDLVVTQLAQADQWASAGISDSTSSLGLSGEIEISVGSTSFNVSVTDSNASLDDLKNAINNEPSNDLVQASLLTVDNGLGGSETRLVLTSTEPGAINSLSIVDLSGDVAAKLDISTQLTEAQDSIITINGLTVTSDNNFVDGAIEGVTLSLNAVSQGVIPTILTVQNDVETMTDSAQGFVDGVNAMISMLNLTSTAAGSDSSFRFMKDSIRLGLTTPTADVGVYASLFEIGITTDPKTGLLQLDKSVFQDALDNSVTSVDAIFTDSKCGIAVNLEALAKDFNDYDGIVQIRTDGINSRIDGVQRQIEREESRLEMVEKRYYSEFQAMDKLVAELDQMSSYFQQQMDGINSSNKK